ncbi:MAG: hypothetical protein WBX11_17080 [Thiobacillaceae bacterium]
MNCLMTVCPKIWFTKTDELPGVASLAACHRRGREGVLFRTPRQVAPLQPCSKGVENHLYMETTMNEKQNYLSCAVLIGLSVLFGSAYAEDAQTLPEPIAAGLMAPEPTAPTAPEPTAPTASEPTGTESTASGPVASGRSAAQSFPGKKISLAPLPFVIYLLENQRPTVTFTTPCAQIEKMTYGFPPFVAFENFMFTWIANVNESNLLPLRIEPVCI